MLKKYMPLLIVEIYLLFTLLVLIFGPVQFRLHDEGLFFLLMALYHLAFSVGYLFSVSTYNFEAHGHRFKFSSKMYYIVFFLAVLSVLISYQNIMLKDSIIPVDIFQDVAKGLSDPGESYSARMDTLSRGDYVASRVTNIGSFFFAFSKLLFIFLFLYFWTDLGRSKKMLSIAYCGFFVLPGLASGVNSVLFTLFIFVSLSIFTILYVRGYRYLNLIIFLCGFLFLIPVGLFGYYMSLRGGGFEYFASTSPLGDVSVVIQTPVLNGLWDFYAYSLVWLNYYLVQGYYGFSLILNMDFDWTFGFGGSAFLQRQLLLISGFDVSALTFQARISQFWDKDAQWHSFYGQLANDFGFVGLSILMFLLGYLLSRAWLAAIYRNSFYGAALMPILALMFIFFPANNQVMGYIDTFSYFLFVGVFRLLEGKRIRWM